VRKGEKGSLVVPIYIAKESEKHWGESEDLSILDFMTIEYKRKRGTQLRPMNS
jgi:hypothetical protein